MSRYADDLALAQMLADAADVISLARFGALDLRVTTKPDLTPVSDADTAIETSLRQLLNAARPEDHVLGEEFGTGAETDAPPGNGRRWVIDPIDGTKNFVRGVPVWATLIALVEGDDPVVGVVSAPAMQRRWWAACDTAAHQRTGSGDPVRITVSAVADLADASLCYASLGAWERIGRLDRMLDLMRGTWRQRAYGDFYGYMLVAQGAAEISVEPELSLWDMAALVPIVTAAGGRFTSLDGHPGPGGGSAVATNGILHAAVTAILEDPESTSPSVSAP
jgi:histidinol-phosphatase